METQRRRSGKWVTGRLTMSSRYQTGRSALSVTVLPRRAQALRRPARAAAESLPGSHVLHESFEARAHARPEAVAVVFGSQGATYAILDRRANCLEGTANPVGSAVPEGGHHHHHH